MSVSAEAEAFLATVDRSSFELQPYIRRVEKPWGYEEHWTPDGLEYMGKRIVVYAGCQLSLQVHDEKTESWLLLSGRGGAVVEDKDGNLVRLFFEPGQGYRSTIGQQHRLFAETESVFIEVSTPENGTTFRLEDDYARPDETEELRNQPGRGYKTA